VNKTHEIDNNYLLNAEAQFKQSAESVLSLYKADTQTFIRDTGSADADFYTSATLHAIIALCGSGCFSDKCNFKDKEKKLKTPYFELRCDNHIEPLALLARLSGFGNADHRWPDMVIKNSSHSKESHSPLRIAIVLDLLLNSLTALFQTNSNLDRDKLIYVSQEIVDSLQKA
jgi:hypothetical protein